MDFWKNMVLNFLAEYIQLVHLRVTVRYKQFIYKDIRHRTEPWSMKNYLASPIRYTTFHKESSIGCAGDKSSEMVIHWVCGRQPLRKGHHWERKLKECFNLCLDIATYVSLTYSMDNFLIMVRPRNDNVLIMVRLRNDNFLIMVKLRNDSY